MDLDLLWDIIEQAGYVGLFLWLWLGIFGAPLPNEVIAMTVGFAASQDVLNSVATFLVTYGGIVAALTTAYSLGRFLGGPLLNILRRRKKFSRLIKRSLYYLQRYHAFSLFFSYFFPGLRNFVPFMYGVSKLPFRSFVLFAYSGSFVWLTITFNLGFWFGDYREEIFKREKEGFIALALLAIIFITYKLFRRRKEKLRTVEK